MRVGLRWRYDLPVRTHVDAIPVQDEIVLLFGTRFLGLLFLLEDSLFFRISHFLSDLE